MNFRDDWEIVLLLGLGVLALIGFALSIWWNLR